MSAFGADPGQLDDLARDLDQLAGLLDHRRMSLTVWIEADRFWRGHSASEFRHAWEHQYAPQISQSVSYLHNAVQVLHDNANQQRVASGESSKDYGATGFLNLLFGGGVQAVEGAVAGTAGLVSEGAHAVAGDVRGLWDNAYDGVAAIGGSQLLKDALPVLSAVGGVLAIASIACPALGVVALGIGVVVMVGHLAQMANQGHFKVGQFAEDALGVAGGGLGMLRYAKSLTSAVEGAENVNLVTRSVSALRDVSQVAKDVTHASNAEKVTRVAIEGTRSAEAVVKSVNTTFAVAGDVRKHDWAQVTKDSLGYVDAAGGAGGTTAQVVGHLADIGKSLSESGDER